jgi:hypothetical protein
METIGETQKTRIDSYWDAIETQMVQCNQSPQASGVPTVEHETQKERMDGSVENRTWMAWRKNS